MMDFGIVENAQIHQELTLHMRKYVNMQIFTYFCKPGNAITCRKYVICGLSQNMQ